MSFASHEFGTAGEVDPLLIFGGFMVVSLICALISHRLHRRKRFIDDIPRSKVRGVFVGMAEVGGTVECAAPLRSFLAECDCIHYRYSVEEHWRRTVTESYTDKDGNRRTRTRVESGWTNVAGDADLCRFFLRDDTGALRIDPAGAEIRANLVFNETCGEGSALYYGKGPSGSVRDSTGTRCFTEHAIRVGDAVEVIGQARERRDAVAAEIAADEAAPMFIVTTTPLEEISSSASLWGHVAFWFIPVVIAIFCVVLAKNGETIPGSLVALGLAAHVLIWLCGWLWNVYNALTDIRNRVRQAWAQVDVLLQLRADLIPNLVACVSAMKGHEKSTQEVVALLRGQLGATRPGKPGPDFDGVSARVIACVEAYPEITSDASFLSLSGGLSDCEARLALARGYYNDFATAYNTRLEVFPGSLVAGAFGFRPKALWLAENLARAPVGVSF